jgi:hypothetical protein
MGWSRPFFVYTARDIILCLLIRMRRTIRTFKSFVVESLLCSLMLGHGKPLDPCNIRLGFSKGKMS